MQLGENLLLVTVKMEQFIQDKGSSPSQEGENEKSCDEISWTRPRSILPKGSRP